MGGSWKILRSHSFRLPSMLSLMSYGFITLDMYISYFGKPSFLGVKWHASLRLDQNLITQGDYPRVIMDSYEECRGPPRLFLLDKYGGVALEPHLPCVEHIGISDLGLLLLS